ncbi:MAG: RNA polymerase sigma factor [Deltaproteobacteria bacterium]|nr:RNA polymerase sigma factor [Deltaproteobacteria bacterium]
MITNPEKDGHLPDMESVSSVQSAQPSQQQPAAPSTGEHGAIGATIAFGEVYDQYFDFIWRSARRLGVAENSLDDAVQDVFLTVHRRLKEFRGDSSIRTWLFGILLHTVRGYRRTARRKPTSPLYSDNVVDAKQTGPHESAAKGEAVELLYRFLDSLDDDKRVVFVQAELEQMTAQEISETMGINPNTVYSRLRSARQAFEEAVIRYRARDGWRYK